MNTQYAYMPFHCNTVFTVFSGDAQNCEPLVDVLAFPQSTLNTTRISPRHSRLCIGGAQRGECACGTLLRERVPWNNGLKRHHGRSRMMSLATSESHKRIAAGRLRQTASQCFADFVRIGFWRSSRLDFDRDDARVIVGRSWGIVDGFTGSRERAWRDAVAEHRWDIVQTLAICRSSPINGYFLSETLQMLHAPNSVDPSFR
jgi:hypothetical protein